jgi:hypothetical protein
MNDAKVLVFAKAPVAGKVKTRLIGPGLDAARATALYRAFLRDVLTKTSSAFETELWWAGEQVSLEGIDVATRPQHGDDLGARMAHAIASTLATCARVVVVGADAPSMPLRILHHAFELLDRHDTVFSPSHDGGYVLLGATKVPTFRDVRWSTRHALADSLRSVARPGGPSNAALTEPWFDVDRPPDLRLLRAHLALDPAAAPATRDALSNPA